MFHRLWNYTCKLYQIRATRYAIAVVALAVAFTIGHNSVKQVTIVNHPVFTLHPRHSKVHIPRGIRFGRK
jgi:hypothetical protein